MGVWLAQGELLVVDTDRDRFLGTVELRGDTFVVRSGRRGRPVVVTVELVRRIVPAAHHADLEA